MAKRQSKEKLRIEIITSLHQINEIACYHLDESQNDLRNKICRELRKIHTRTDKLTSIKHKL